LYVKDEEWEQMKSSGEQIDDRIVEVHWDVVNSHWRMMRFRDDKPNGNYRSVVENIIQSIAEGVEKDALLARSNVIREAWRARQLPLPSNSRPPQPPRMDAASSRPPPTFSERPVAELRYGPLGSSRWSKVSGPGVIAGMNR